jgi:hypothetical protein
MNVFVLSTGRCGSQTFARAAAHATNVTTGHETRARELDRLSYPPSHIESDNRLTWFLGPLAARFPEARYVHLIRDTEAIAQSYLRRWEAPVTIGRGWKEFVRMGGGGSPIECCREYVEATNENIRHFLRDKPHVTVQLESAHTDFRRFWEWASLEGDLVAALGEWDVRHDAYG